MQIPKLPWPFWAVDLRWGWWFWGRRAPLALRRVQWQGNALPFTGPMFWEFLSFPELSYVPSTWRFFFSHNHCFLLSGSSNCLVHSVGYTLLSYLQWSVSLHVCVLSHFSHVQLFATAWTLAHRAPLSMGFSRHGYWSGLPCPPPGDLPDPGIKPISQVSCIGQWVLYPTSATWVAHCPARPRQTRGDGSDTTPECPAPPRGHSEPRPWPSWEYRAKPGAQEQAGSSSALGVWALAGSQAQKQVIAKCFGHGAASQWQGTWPEDSMGRDEKMWTGPTGAQTKNFFFFSKRAQHSEKFPEDTIWHGCEELILV